MLFSRLVGYTGYRGNIFLCAKKKHTVPKEIHFSRYHMKCSGENVILRGIVHVVWVCFSVYTTNLQQNVGARLYSEDSKYCALARRPHKVGANPRSQSMPSSDWTSMGTNIRYKKITFLLVLWIWAFNLQRSLTILKNKKFSLMYLFFHPVTMRTGLRNLFCTLLINFNTLDSNLVL